MAGQPDIEALAVRCAQAPDQAGPLVGFYRKYRVIFVDRKPFPYHRARLEALAGA